MEKTKAFFTFKKILGQTIIKYVYTIVALLITIGGILIIFNGGGDIIFGFLIIIFGNLFWRLSCERWMLTFRIYDTMESIERSFSKKRYSKLPPQE